MTRRRWCFIGGLTVCGLVMVAALGRAADEPPARLLTLFGDADHFAAIANPQKVEAFRIKDMTKPPDPGAPSPIAGFTVLSGPVGVEAQLAKELSRILTDEKSYVWDKAKKCDPEYGVALRFVGEKSSLDVLLCFQCDQLAVRSGGKGLGHKDFDPARPALVKLVKQIFPKDIEIQQLIETRPKSKS
jgi:hypothetical protein